MASPAVLCPMKLPHLRLQRAPSLCMRSFCKSMSPTKLHRRGRPGWRCPEAPAVKRSTLLATASEDWFLNRSEQPPVLPCKATRPKAVPSSVPRVREIIIRSFAHICILCSYRPVTTSFVCWQCIGFREQGRVIVQSARRSGCCSSSAGPSHASYADVAAHIRSSEAVAGLSCLLSRLVCYCMFVSSQTAAD